MKTTLVLILGLISLQVLSQSKIYTSIQANKKKYPDVDFYFEHILDRRLNKENIGNIYKSSLTYIHPADFKKALPQEFLNFFRTSFPNHNSLNRVLLAVNNFEINHIVTGKNLDTGTVKGNFDFYLLKNDSAFFLYNFTHELIDISDRITYSHPNRMKRILLMSISKLDSIIQNNKEVFTFNLGLIADSLRLESSTVTKRKLILKDSLAKANYYPSEYFLLLGSNVDFTTDNIFAYFNCDLLFRFKKHQRWLIGPSVEYLYYDTYFNNPLPYNIDYIFKNLNLGFRVLNQIHKDIFISVKALGVFGKEYYKIDSQPYAYTSQGFQQIGSGNETPSVFGLEFSSGIYLIPARTQNFYTGLDLFFRTTDSRFIDDNIGLKINIGFKF